MFSSISALVSKATYGLTKKRHHHLLPDDYLSDEAFHTHDLRLHLMPKVNGSFDYTGDGVEWEANLVVWTKDVAQLMREGLHWSSANVDRERGGMQHTEAAACILRDRRCGTVRTFVLADHGDIPRWEAIFIVAARNLNTLASFQLPDGLHSGSDGLSPDSVWAAMAWNKEGQQVYKYNADRALRYNTIYGLMPLAGWWPWPKSEPQRALAPAVDDSNSEHAKEEDKAAPDQLGQKHTSDEGLLFDAPPPYNMES